MTDHTAPDDFAADLTASVPFLRRYARALTGAQQSGDAHALAALEAVVGDVKTLATASTPKIGLFRTFHQLWVSTGTPASKATPEDDFLEARAQWRLSTLGPNTREALLLRSIEGFDDTEIAEIMGVDPGKAASLVAQARRDIGQMVSGNVLIIEDEAIIAMDLESAVSALGHTVVGVASTRDAAVKLGTATRPDLILADIQLADKSSGIDAVNQLLETLGAVPVIFITAFPERLLTGDRPEPAFLITKPYAEDQVRTAVSQAMFFASTDSLKKSA
ncbi:MAG: response regulator [Pseudomonadota bacterium]